MESDRVIESTIGFQFDGREYENAHDIPTYYRALKREPRHEHPFNSYTDIMRQPELIHQSLQDLREKVAHLAAQIIERGAKRILLTGLGSSYNVGASAAYAFWRIAGMPAEYDGSAESLVAGKIFEYDQSVVIGLSASGNTLETVQHLKAARLAGAYTLACANLDHTRLTAAAHESLVIPGGYGLVWDFPTRLAILYQLSLEIARQNGREDIELEILQECLDSLPEIMGETLANIDLRCNQLGSELASMRAILLPATGEMLPIAWEIALRFEEMAQIPSRGYPIVDYLHGSIGMLAPDIPTLLLAPSRNSYELELRVARVTREVKTPSYAVLDGDDPGDISKIVDSVVRVPVIHPLLKPLIYLIPGQLMAYYASVAQPGGNPEAQRTDQPRYARAFDIAMPPKSH